MEDNISVILECPNTEILGVFGKTINLLTHGYKINEEDNEEDFDCILLLSEKTYLQEWKKWIKGKKDYCERFGHYCGVTGYVVIDNAIYVGTQQINKWNKDKEDMEIVNAPVYKVDVINCEPDFEHG